MKCFRGAAIEFGGLSPPIRACADQDLVCIKKRIVKPFFKNIQYISCFWYIFSYKHLKLLVSEIGFKTI